MSPAAADRAQNPGVHPWPGAHWSGVLPARHGKVGDLPFASASVTAANRQSAENIQTVIRSPRDHARLTRYVRVADYTSRTYVIAVIWREPGSLCAFLSSSSEGGLRMRMLSRPGAKVIVDMMACVLLATVARAQDSLHRQLVFSAPVTQAQCHQFPLEDFDIGPSGDRANSKDLLNVRCEPRAHGPFALTLTFTFDTNGPSGPRGVRGQVFSFRWGKSMNGPSPAFSGQFTHNTDLCSRLTGLLNSKVLKWRARREFTRPPELTSSCNPDDVWGTSMEIELTADFPGSAN